MSKIGRSFNAKSVSIKSHSHAGKGPAVPVQYAHEQRVIDRVTNKALHAKPRKA